jgi:hypothetical protein
VRRYTSAADAFCCLCGISREARRPWSRLGSPIKVNLEVLVKFGEPQQLKNSIGWIENGQTLRALDGLVTKAHQCAYAGAIDEGTQPSCR